VPTFLKNGLACFARGEELERCAAVESSVVAYPGSPFLARARGYVLEVRGDLSQWYPTTGAKTRGLVISMRLLANRVDAIGGSRGARFCFRWVALIRHRSTGHDDGWQ